MPSALIAEKVVGKSFFHVKPKQINVQNMTYSDVHINFPRSYLATHLVDGGGENDGGV